MTTQPETAQPELRDADAQEIADRITPFVAAEGFTAEWALYGPELVRAHIDKSVADARKRLDTALSELSRVEGKESSGPFGRSGFVTLHYSLATGRSMTTDAPEQGESRIILDGSCERSRLATLRGLCRLLRDPEQQILASAGEVTIATAPLDQSSWILANAAHPDGRCAGLRVVILLPTLAHENNHYTDMHKIAHLAVANSRLAAGKSTLIWLSGLHYSEIRGLAKEIENPRGTLRIVPTGAAKLLSAVHPDGIAGAFRKSYHVVFSPAWEPGKHPPVHSRPFHKRVAETLILLLGISRNVSLKETYGPAEIDPGFGATIFARGEAAKYWHAVLDTWRRGDKPYYLPVTLDDYSELARAYRSADWLYDSYSGCADKERPWLDEAPPETGGGHAS